MVVGRLTGYLHVKDVLDLADDESAAVPAERVRALPELPATAPLADALGTLRRYRAHLGLVVDASGGSLGVVTMEDLVERYVGTVREATHRP